MAGRKVSFCFPSRKAPDGFSFVVLTGMPLFSGVMKLPGKAAVRRGRKADFYLPEGWKKQRPTSFNIPFAFVL